MRPEQRSNIWLLGVLIVILLFFVVIEPSYGWKLRQIFTPSNVVFQNSDASAGDANGSLATENDSLKARLAELTKVAATLPTSSPDYIRAMVYSRYPLNFKNELLLDAGARGGVKIGSAVVFQGLLVGRVTKVWDGYCVAQTVFDDTFKMPVRIGSGGYDGLLTGGSYPFVASIAKSSSLKANDIVYTAASGMPYAIPVGEVQSTSTSADNLFMQATIAFPYDVNNIQTVLIAK